jgi:hypothetical protein
MMIQMTIEQATPHAPGADRTGIGRLTRPVKQATGRNHSAG